MIGNYILVKICLSGNEIYFQGHVNLGPEVQCLFKDKQDLS